MSSKRPTSAERRQRLNEQHQLVQAALNYLSYLANAEGATASDESAAHVERMRAEAHNQHQQGKLALLNKSFRDIAAPSLIQDAAGFAAYIRQATGLSIDVKSDFEKRVARVCKRKLIRTTAEFYDVRDMIDCLDVTNPAHQEQLQLLYDLVAEHEGFTDAKDVGKPRKPVKARQYSSREVLRLPSPDGRKILTVTESTYNGEDPCTQLMLEYPEHRSGAGLYHVNRVNAGITAQWESNALLVIDVSQAPFNEQYPRQDQRGPMNEADRVVVQLLSRH